MTINCTTKFFLLISAKISYRQALMRRCFLFVLLINSICCHAMGPKLNWDTAVENAINRYGSPEEPKLINWFKHSGVAYPPRELALLAFKQERVLQLWARDENTSWHYIHAYPLTAFSGRLGPKLKEHDLQIPEGLYRLTSLNPFSSMHLSMMIDYPNGFDRLQASRDGRNHLGSNIFLHGKSLSVGCLAVGNKAIDQLFLLVHRVGLSHVRLIISPNDLRRGKPATPNFAQPRWLPDLYRQIEHALHQFPLNDYDYSSSLATTKMPGAFRKYSW
jgi:hypothetical protein